MKKITKEGQQLTAAQALDFILQTLDNWRRGADKKIDMQSNLDHVMLGKSLAYDEVYDFVEVLRAEKFDCVKTDNPIQVVADSRSYGI